MQKYILSLYFGYHDSNIAISDGKSILLHLEAERVYRKKHMRFETKEEMVDFIKIGLDYLGLNIDDIEKVYLANWNNKFSGKTINILGKSFDPIFTSHHFNHVGCAFPSKFEKSLIVCADGGSEDGTTKLYLKTGSKIEMVEDLDNTVMTGKFYGTLTQMIITPKFGRAHDTEPGKTMGLAAYGKENSEIRALVENNSEEMNKLHMNGCEHLLKKFGLSGDYSKPWTDQRRCDLAYVGQDFWVKTFLKKIISYSDKVENVCLVGGCALNVNLNSELVQSNKFKNVYVTPVSSDCGQSIGAILYHNQEIECSYPYLGRGYGEIDSFPELLLKDILDNKIVAWYQGRSESGPRALGHRSFIGLANSLEMKRKLSEDVKKREPYRPVAPIVAEEFLTNYFDTNIASPFMTFSPTAKATTKRMAPAIIHADGTSRIQTLNNQENPIIHELLMKVMEKTGVPIIMNSSLNVMGEPIVDTPEDALANFEHSGADVLYINGKRYEKTKDKN